MPERARKQQKRKSRRKPVTVDKLLYSGTKPVPHKFIEERDDLMELGEKIHRLLAQLIAEQEGGVITSHEVEKIEDPPQDAESKDKTA